MNLRTRPTNFIVDYFGSDAGGNNLGLWPSVACPALWPSGKGNQNRLRLWALPHWFKSRRAAAPGPRKIWSTSASGTFAGVTGTASWSNKFDRYGWMVGAGVEYAVTNNLTIKAEYNFLDFGTAKETLSIVAAVPSKLNVVKVGVNYLFN
jgi:opacity protein-like surface antigen